ncbi:MAG: 7-cyano-7-deazaguanine synthase [Dehalococcoidia bacterium]|nr:7-cyano-7-deazaguanine synthase [Dehalococcoidia bacterium]
MSYDYDFAGEFTPVGSEDNYWLDDEHLSCAFHQEVPRRMADLLEVAMSVYAADRLSPRSYKGMNTGHGQINMRVGVHDPDFWARPEMTGLLSQFLYWVSEDEWAFEFVRRQAPTAVESQGFLFPIPPEDSVTVSLFSGGLDSLAGLAKRSRENAVASHVLVSGYTHNRLVGQQRRQAKMITSAWRRHQALGQRPELRHIAVPFGLKKYRPVGRDEPTQRTRALVFLSLGAVAAAQARSDTLWVYENGTGAFNLPLNASQPGVDNYRGIHPRSLIMAERLFELALEKEIRIFNPYLFDTKAEMYRSLVISGLVEVVRETVSCDNYPVRVQDKTQCGHCTSCVLRRQPIRCGGLMGYDAPEDYLYDVLDNATDIDRDKLHGLEVMRGQVYELERCLSHDDPWLALASSFPELERTCLELAGHRKDDANRIRDRILGLYRTYVREWKSLPNILRRAA